MLETLSLAPAVTPLAVLDSTKAKPPNPTSNDPSGIWQADSGSQYEIRFTGSTAQVKLVPGSNPKYRLDEVALQNQDDAKTYNFRTPDIRPWESVHFLITQHTRPPRIA